MLTFMKALQDKDPHIVPLTDGQHVCPHCNSVLINYSTDELGCLTETYSYPDTNLYYDGDTVQIPAHLSFAPFERYDNQLLFGTCPSCHEDYYSVILWLASRPVHNDNDMFLVSEPLQSSMIQLYGPMDIPKWIMKRYWSVKVDGDPDPASLIVDEHRLGPFVFDRKHRIWDLAAALVSVVGREGLVLIEAAHQESLEELPVNITYTYLVVTPHSCESYPNQELLLRSYKKTDELQGHPVLDGLVGPMFGGVEEGKRVIRYETIQAASIYSN